jgi:hypothetical protein
MTWVASSSSSNDQVAVSMGVATTQMPYLCAGEQRRSGIAALRSTSMVSNGIEPQVMEVA